MISTILSLLIAASSAPPAACNFYVARDYPSMKLELRDTMVAIVFEKWSKTMQRAITKPFGVLQEAAVEEDGRTAHIFSMTKVDGRDALIFSSIVFFPDCPKGSK